MDLGEQLNDLFWQGASHLPHVSTIQAATVKLMSVTCKGRACRALAFRRVEAPLPQPKGAADGVRKKSLLSDKPEA
jgi:hypothetical protein